MDVTINLHLLFIYLPVGVFLHILADTLGSVGDDDGVYEVVLISPSVTTFVDVNPSFRLLELDPDTYELVDYHQFNLNITHANGTSNRMRISFNCIRQTSWLSDISTPRVSH